jgi:hypothetical protein
VTVKQVQVYSPSSIANTDLRFVLGVFLHNLGGTFVLRKIQESSIKINRAGIGSEKIVIQLEKKSYPKFSEIKLKTIIFQMASTLQKDLPGDKN